MRGIDRGRKAAAALCIGLILGLAAVVFAADRKTGDKTFETSAAHGVGTEYSSGFHVESYAEGVLLFSLSGVSGTPTVRLVAETSLDNSSYFHHSDIGTASAAGATSYPITNFGKYLRIKQVITGGASNDTATYEIKGVFKN